MGEFPVLLAKHWNPDRVDPVGWWMSEKWDGVRAYWTGQMFFSRAANVFSAPDWFMEGLPPVALDGEFFIDRKRFNYTSGIVRRKKPPFDKWKEIKFYVFDAPGINGAFEDRMAWLQANLRAPYAYLVPQERVESPRHLQERLDKVAALGGEGLMLRKPYSLYERVRSETLLKVKLWEQDEAKVIGHEPWRGVKRPGCEGWTGALRCQLRDGTEFKIGSGLEDSDRIEPPPIGSIVTFKYGELSPEEGKPRWPIFIGVCADKEW